MELDITEFESSSDGDDTNIQLTSAELIEMMEEIWINEKFAPEILPNKLDVVDHVLGQISYMEQNLRTLSSSDFKKGLHQLEVDRIRYLVTSYLRNRLEKIETYIYPILKEEDERAEKGETLYLTTPELQFALSYKQGLEQHFDNITSFFPGPLIENWKDQPILPNMKSFVFVKAKSSVEGVVIDVADNDGGEDVVDLNPGSQMIISYSSIANLVKNSDIKLI